MEQSEYNQIISDLKECVAKGDVEAMKWLGDLYYQGIYGNDENVFAALPYWKMAADYGDSERAFKVGICLLYGKGCEANAAQGLRYFVKSAQSGNAEAQYYVGLCYIHGDGTERDYQTGKQYLSKAALQNHARAQFDLANAIFREEKRISTDMVYWLCCAHLNGVSEAANALEVIISIPKKAKHVQEMLDHIRKYGIQNGSVSLN